MAVRRLLAEDPEVEIERLGRMGSSWALLIRASEGQSVGLPRSMLRAERVTGMSLRGVQRAGPPVDSWDPTAEEE